MKFESLNASQPGASKDVFVPLTPTVTGTYAALGSDFAHMSGHIVSVRVNTYMVIQMW